MANISWSHYLCRNALGSLCTCLHSHGTVHSWRLRVNEPLATNLSWTTKLWGSTTHGYFDAGVCVCVCRGMEKRLTQHCCAVGNRPGTTDTKVPRVLGSTVSHLEINERRVFFSRRTPRTFTFEMGCLFARGRGQWSKLVSTAFHIKPEPRQEFYGGWSQRQSKEKVSAARCRGTGVTLLTIKVTRAACAWQR